MTSEVDLSDFIILILVYNLLTVLIYVRYEGAPE